MSAIDDRLAELGIELPEPFAAPPGITFRFERVLVHDGIAQISGHGPMDGDRVLASGAVGEAVSVEEAAAAGRLTALSILASLRAELGDLDRIERWVKATGFVNVAPGFNSMPAVVNGFSELVLEVWGPDAGAHARSAIGVAALPFDWPVEVEASVAIRD
ncbi:MAG: RidA family protein [Solirubrobacterales bacterium]